MTGGWAARRFWTDVSVVETGQGYGVRLDARVVLTPGKIALTLPSRAMAQAVAAEWAAQDGVIDPQTMPVTRAANSAVERVRPQRAEVAAMLAAYAETDLICHRAEAPDALGGPDPWCMSGADQGYLARATAAPSPGRTGRACGGAG